jgi:hypothetical protein
MKFGRNQPRSQPIVRVARLAGPELVALLLRSLSREYCCRLSKGFAPGGLMPFWNIEMAGGIFQGSAGWRGPCPALYSRKNLFSIKGGQWSRPDSVVLTSCPMASEIGRQTATVVIADRCELLGARGAFLERPPAIVLEHQGGGAPDVDLGNHVAEFPRADRRLQDGSAVGTQTFTRHLFLLN